MSALLKLGKKVPPLTPLEATTWYSDLSDEAKEKAAAELAALREIARLARIVRDRYPGLLAVMWENDNEGSRKLPYMREKFDAAFAALDGKDAE